MRVALRVDAILMPPSCRHARLLLLVFSPIISLPCHADLPRFSLMLTTCTAGRGIRYAAMLIFDYLLMPLISSRLSSFLFLRITPALITPLRLLRLMFRHALIFRLFAFAIFHAICRRLFSP